VRRAALMRPAMPRLPMANRRSLSAGSRLRSAAGEPPFSDRGRSWPHTCEVIGEVNLTWTMVEDGDGLCVSEVPGAWRTRRPTRCDSGANRRRVLGVWSCLSGIDRPGTSERVEDHRESAADIQIRILAPRYRCSEIAPMPWPGNCCARVTLSRWHGDGKACEQRGGFLFWPRGPPLFVFEDDGCRTYLRQKPSSSCYVGSILAHIDGPCWGS